MTKPEPLTKGKLRKFVPSSMCEEINEMGEFPAQDLPVIEIYDKEEVKAAVLWFEIEIRKMMKGEFINRPSPYNSAMIDVLCKLREAFPDVFEGEE